MHVCIACFLTYSQEHKPVGTSDISEPRLPANYAVVADYEPAEANETGLTEGTLAKVLCKTPTGKLVVNMFTM